MLLKCMQTIHHFIKIPQTHQNSRQLWHWVNLTFNRVDQERLSKFGPDRVCAEWILRNGGKVKFVGVKDYLFDYNLLPPEGTTLQIKEVDASSSSIMDVGFDHFVGCKQISKIVLHDCNYLKDGCLKLLKPLNPTLRILQVSKCANITDKGLLHLSELTNLSNLVLFDLQYVKNTHGLVHDLKLALPKCNIMYKT
ncbi:ATP synthase subunit s, mitochondrial [Onthophagus taurus]|uniref:ATP synthase subunit s, mitochondrial n=1 Tax=Onthophagus taurus TaxID=166361 RepID=UPI000C200E9A|nr:ATP synthase subunit s, mitochondrial [Onthophagus taurus]